MNGIVVQRRNINPYDNVFMTPISLIVYPKGVYVVRLIGEEVMATKRTIIE